MVRRPPSFVVTTPESLYLLVTSAQGREALRTVETVIVDEIHAVARDKRGAHLALTLERLEALCDRRPGAHRAVGHAAPDRDGRPPARRRPAAARRSSTSATSATSTSRSSCPRASSRRSRRPSRWPTCSTASPRSSREHRTTLVFVNTRRLAERLAHQLGERLGDDVVAAHHGSLSKERRHRVETPAARRRPQGAGRHRVARARHRHRAGRARVPDRLAPQHRHVPPAGRPLQPQPRRHAEGPPLPADPRRARRVRARCWRRCAPAASTPSSPPRLPLDIVAQQIVAEVAAQEWRTDDLYELVRRAAPVHRADPGPVRRGRRPRGRGHRDRPRPARRVRAPRRGQRRAARRRKGARLAAATSGGAIPETGDYRVVAEPDDTFIGTVNEDWAVESMAGDIFLLGTHSWQIRRIEAGVVRVRDAGDAPPTIPFWLGEAPARTAELSDEVSELRHRVDEYLAAGDPDGARRG